MDILVWITGEKTQSKYWSRKQETFKPNYYFSILNVTNKSELIQEKNLFYFLLSNFR